MSDAVYCYTCRTFRGLSVCVVLVVPIGNTDARWWLLRNQWRHCRAKVVLFTYVRHYSWAWSVFDSLILGTSNFHLKVWIFTVQISGMCTYKMAAKASWHRNYVTVTKHCKVNERLLKNLGRAATNFAAWWTEARWVWTACLRLLPDSVATAIWA